MLKVLIFLALVSLAAASPIYPIHVPSPYQQTMDEEYFNPFNPAESPVVRTAVIREQYRPLYSEYNPYQVHIPHVYRPVIRPPNIYLSPDHPAVDKFVASFSPLEYADLVDGEKKKKKKEK